MESTPHPPTISSIVQTYRPQLKKAFFWKAFFVSTITKADFEPMTLPFFVQRCKWSVAGVITSKYIESK
jgi:hypothetical protein